MPTQMTVDVRNWNYEDKVKFVQSTEECSAAGTEYAFEESVPNVLNVVFATAGVYKMCYKYADLEVYREVPSYTMTVHSMESESHVVLVKDILQTVTLDLLGSGMEAEQSLCFLLASCRFSARCRRRRSVET